MLFHRDLGGAGRPPIVLLHGFLGSSRNWQTAGAGLVSRYHVFALDLRNHGRSPHASEMTHEALAADVLAWMDAQGFARVALLGHSLGGKVAMRLACRSPGRVDRLIVVDIAPKAYPEYAQRIEIEAMTRLELEAIGSRADAERRLEGWVKDWAMRKFLTTNLERDSDGKWRWIVNLAVLATALPDLVASPVGPDERYEGPTLFILGGRSSFVAPEDHAAIHRRFPAARIETLPDSGHNPHLEAREAFVDLVLRD
jgi:esterase